jgi:hypothetical protein
MARFCPQRGFRVYPDGGMHRRVMVGSRLDHATGLRDDGPNWR